MAIVELDKIRGSIVGYPGQSGLSVEQRKTPLHRCAMRTHGRCLQCAVVRKPKWRHYTAGARLDRGSHPVQTIASTAGVLGAPHMCADPTQCLLEPLALCAEASCIERCTPFAPYDP